MASIDPDQFHLFTGQALRLTPAASPAPAADQDHARPLRLSVLGSGSGGNCSAIQYAGGLLLIDAGFGPRTIDHRLKRIGATFSQIKAICLTHLDSDHFRGHLIASLLKWRIPLYMHENHFNRFWHLEDASELHEEGLVRLFTSQPFSPMEGMTISHVRTAHDAAGTCAFRMHTPLGSIGYATDLGHAPPELIEHMLGVDVLAIESNYDHHMQLASARPRYLKERIMGPSGHLSNDQCKEALRQVMARCQAGGPARIVLLHRSRQCNCPTIIRSMYADDATLFARLILSEQDAPLPWVEVGRPFSTHD